MYQILIYGNMILFYLVKYFSLSADPVISNTSFKRPFLRENKSPYTNQATICTYAVALKMFSTVLQK